MSAEENKALVLSLYEEVINTGELDRAHELLAPDFAEHEEVPVPAHLTGVDAFEEFFSMLRSAFPDLRMDVKDMLAEGEKVVARIEVHGTHQGEFMSMPPSGERIEVTATDIFRLEGGKIAEHWGNFDNLGMMQQLGAISPPGQPSG